LFVFFSSVIDSRAACKLACLDSARPTFDLRAGLGIGFSNRPSSNFTLRMRAHRFINRDCAAPRPLYQRDQVIAESL